MHSNHNFDCLIDSELDRIENFYAINDESEEQASDLMQLGANYDPLEAGNLAEVLSESSKDWYEKLCIDLSAGNLKEASEKIIKRSQEYWFEFARSVAEERILKESEN